MPVHVMIAVPTMGTVQSRLAGQLLEWGRAYPEAQLSFFMTQRMFPHDRARNRIVRQFLDEARATHLFMIDADMVPPPDAVERLLSHDLPFVTGMTPLPVDASDGKRPVVDFCFALPDEPGGPLRPLARNSGLRPVRRCGAGCLMLRRDLLAGMEPPWFRFAYSAEGTELVTSEDVGFCDRLAAAGVPMHADTGVVCRHEKALLL